MIWETADELARFAKRLPCRIITGREGPYLSRFTLVDLPHGGHIYLHFFHRSDEDVELHNHPWSGASLILTGGYREYRREWVVDRWCLRLQTYLPGETNTLLPDTFHRINLLDPAAGCWTLFTTNAVEQSWGFWHPTTQQFTPWKEFISRKGMVTP